VGLERAARVEAEPAEPQQPGAHHRHGQVVWLHRLVAVATPPAEHERAHERGHARRDVHDGAAGEVERAQPLEPAAVAPHPVREGVVHEGRPQHREEQEGRELLALGEGARDQRRRDDREHELEEHERGGAQHPRRVAPVDFRRGRGRRRRGRGGGGAWRRRGLLRQDRARGDAEHEQGEQGECQSLHAGLLCHSADWSRSPVRMRMAVSTGVTKILPSPMLPVLSAAATTSATLSTNWSGTTTSILIFGRKSTVYSPPRYSSVCPFCRPKPRTSDTVMPITPMPVSASLTSSSLNGLMIASIFFITILP